VNALSLLLSGLASGLIFGVVLGRVAPLWLCLVVVLLSVVFIVASEMLKLGKAIK